jgi:hypothetical protein
MDHAGGRNMAWEPNKITRKKTYDDSATALRDQGDDIKS